MLCAGRRHARVDGSVAEGWRESACAVVRDSCGHAWVTACWGTFTCEGVGGENACTGSLCLCRSANPRSVARRTSIRPTMVAVSAIVHFLGQEAAPGSASSEGEAEGGQLRAPQTTSTPSVAGAAATAAWPCPRSLSSPSIGYTAGRTPWTLLSGSGARSRLCISNKLPQEDDAPGPHHNLRGKCSYYNSFLLLPLHCTSSVSSPLSTAAGVTV